MLDRLARATRDFDEGSANAVLDRALERLTLDSVVGSLVMPFLSDLGARWEAGDVSVAQEHFATSLLRGRLLALARNWGAGSGPLALLACPPGELHDLGLICFGLALRERGWRITLLGANTPIATATDAATSLDPSLIVLAVFDHQRMRAHADAVHELAQQFPVALAGLAANEAVAEATGASVLVGGPVEAARAVADPRGQRDPSTDLRTAAGRRDDTA